MPRTEWTPLAERDLEEIAFYIGVQDQRPATGARIVREIKAKCERYANAAEMGTAVPELGEDCRYFTHQRWVIIYLATDLPGLATPWRIAFRQTAKGSAVWHDGCL